MATAALRNPVEDASSAAIATALAVGVVADIEQRLDEARTAAEQIADAIKPLAFDAARGEGDSAHRLAELRTAVRRTRKQFPTSMPPWPRPSRAWLRPAAEHAADDAAILEHARALAAEFIEQSARIDRALLEIVAAHGERRRLAAAILKTGCLHPAWHHAFDCPTRMHHALSVSGAASILASNLPVSSGEVFTISPLAVADRQTLSALSLEHRTARSNF